MHEILEIENVSEFPASTNNGTEAGQKTIADETIISQNQQMSSGFDENSSDELPKNISNYFKNKPQDYASSYDTVVLEVEEIEKSPAGSVKDMDLNDPFLNPEELSEISIADLLALVKGDAKKYIPTVQENSDTMTQKLISTPDPSTILKDVIRMTQENRPYVFATTTAT